ncbi:MAG: M23 family metallopeptidase [Actinobacteria bacterium]|nr:M23 family metallopeptidase [Actinomycetota bacterium]
MELATGQALFVLALLTLAAMTAALLLPSNGTTTVVAAEADALRNHRSVPEGSADTDARPAGEARTADTVGGRAEQRRAAEAETHGDDVSEERETGSGPAGEQSDDVRESEAALRIVGEKDEAALDEQREEKADRRKKAAEKKNKKKEAQEASSPFPEGPSRLFARHDGMHLFTPSADPVRIGFHEAAYRTAVGMIPLGRALANDNGGKYQLPPLTPTDQQYLVLSSRGRPHHATSAVDIVMRPGEPVRSVVTGMVVEVKPYMLYGVHPDAMIRIRSVEDNGKIVTMLHVTGTRVHVGQQVLAGETIVADSATSFPFLSQIDYYLGGEPHPHVHVEVKRG